MGKLEIADMNFEEALQELEIIIEKLESGEVPLEETITLYDRGSELKKHCELKLQSAEEKIQRISLSQKASGDLKIEDV
ncbi:MAG: exodeoxyribonuclease VII small subunit [Paracoccaceae bacterium]|jgi:exodeoxyribonuclease VII small subunit|nr:exodeoxyribonuclease VII small subunit [Paracoccaceae bacterium]